MSDVDDLVMMEAELVVLEAVRSMAEHTRSLADECHLLNYKSSTEAATMFRRSFYDLLVNISASQTSLISMFETLCESHGADYRGSDSPE